MLLFSSKNEAYKTPFGAAKTRETVAITFPVHESMGVKTVKMFVRGRESHQFLLEPGACEKGYQHYLVDFCLRVAGIYYYRFELETWDGATLYVGRDQNGNAVVGEWLPEWQLTVYRQDFVTPDWLKGGLIYHIFPDRFNRVEDNQKPRFGVLKPWDADVTICDPDGVFRANDFFGGNLLGVIKKLPYLSKLGVSAIYFSPFYESSSNHRYDIGDYLKIDPLFGTEEQFQTLVAECDKRDIAIILDGVFNHTGADSIYFNKFSHYDSVGAYQSKDSPYYPWYTFHHYPNEYDCWWGVTVVPSISREAEGFQQFIAGENGVIETWLKRGVKGFRLDVVDELSPQFVKKIRKTIKRMGDYAVIGEVWEDASTKVSYSEEREYLLGEELDGVMNYPFRTAILDYCIHLGGEQFVRRVGEIVENYPQETLDCSMTLVGTHDTVRVINALSGITPSPNKWERLQMRLPKPAYDLGKTRQKIAAALQYFLPGIPTVYYGDEVGLEGFDDPINRRPMLFEQGDQDLLKFYQTLGKLRKQYRSHFVGRASICNTGDVVQIGRGPLTLVANPTANAFLLEKPQKDRITNQTISEVPPYSVAVLVDKKA